MEVGELKCFKYIFLQYEYRRNFLFFKFHTDKDTRILDEINVNEAVKGNYSGFILHPSDIFFEHKLRTFSDLFKNSIRLLIHKYLTPVSITNTNSDGTEGMAPLFIKCLHNTSSINLYHQARIDSSYLDYDVNLFESINNSQPSTTSSIPPAIISLRLNGGFLGNSLNPLLHENNKLVEMNDDGEFLFFNKFLKPYCNE